MSQTLETSIGTRARSVLVSLFSWSAIGLVVFAMWAITLAIPGVQGHWAILLQTTSLPLRLMRDLFLLYVVSSFLVCWVVAMCYCVIDTRQTRTARAGMLLLLLFAGPFAELPYYWLYVRPFERHRRRPIASPAG